MVARGERCCRQGSCRNSIVRRVPENEPKEFEGLCFGARALQLQRQFSHALRVDRLGFERVLTQSQGCFRVFVDEYQPFRIQAHWLADGWQVEISQHDFARYIDKSIFISKGLWETEQLESYQYFTEDDFQRELAALDLRILELRKLTVNRDKWRSKVSIETPGSDFPDEHILIVAASAGEG